jgi:CRISPR-associated protein Cas2
MAGEGAMLFVVAYDISVDRRRTRVHNVLCAYGRWTQFSLFECWLTRKQVVELRGKLAKVLVAEEDHVRLYPLCEGCQGKVVTIGGEPPADEVVLFV